MDWWRRTLPLLAWLGALASGLVLFHGLGRGGMAPPPLVDPGAWGPWLDDREPVVAAMAVLRLVVLALAWYLVGVTTIGLVARMVRRAGLLRVADALTVPMVRRLLQGALGLSLATAMVAAPTAPVGRDVEAPRMSVAAGRPTAGATPAVGAGRPDGSGEGPRPTPASVPRALASEGRDAQGRTAAPLPEADAEQGSPGGPVSMRLVEQDAADAVDDPHAVPRPVAEGDGPVDDDGAPNGRHRVVAGESLWSIAREALARHRAREPSDAEVLGYWQDVIERNRGSLADPDNPDLIFPGDEVVLPAVPDPG